MPGDTDNTTIMMALNELIDAINQLAAKLVPEGPAPDGSYDPPLDKTILGGLAGAAAGGALGAGLGRVDQPFPEDYLAYKCLTAKRVVGAICSIPYTMDLALKSGTILVGAQVSFLMLYLTSVSPLIMAVLSAPVIHSISTTLKTVLELSGVALGDFNAKLAVIAEVLVCKVYSASSAEEAHDNVTAYILSRGDFTATDKALAVALFNIEIIGAGWSNPQRFDPLEGITLGPFTIVRTTEYDWWPQMDCAGCPDPNDPWACDDTATVVPFKQVDISTPPPVVLGSPLGVGQHTLTSQLYGFSNKLTLWKDELQPSCIKLISCTTVNLTLSLSNADYPDWSGWEVVPIATLFAGAKANLIELSAPDSEPVFEAVIEIY